jgi:hypothetical protein
VSAGRHYLATTRGGLRPARCHEAQAPSRTGDPSGDNFRRRARRARRPGRHHPATAS